MIVPLLIFHFVFLSKRSCMLVTFKNCLELVMVSGNITNLSKWPQCKSSRIFDQLGDGVHHKQLPCVWVAVQKYVCHILVSNTEEQWKKQSHSSILHFKLTSHSQLHWKEKCFSFFYPLYSFKHYHKKLTTRNIFQAGHEISLHTLQASSGFATKISLHIPDTILPFTPLADVIMNLPASVTCKWLLHPFMPYPYCPDNLFCLHSAPQLPGPGPGVLHSAMLIIHIPEKAVAPHLLSLEQAQVSPTLSVRRGAVTCAHSCTGSHRPV